MEAKGKERHREREVKTKRDEDKVRRRGQDVDKKREIKGPVRQKNQRNTGKDSVLRIARPDLRGLNILSEKR